MSAQAVSANPRCRRTVGAHLVVRAVVVCSAVALVLAAFAPAARAAVDFRLTIVGNGKVEYRFLPVSDCPPECDIVVYGVTGAVLFDTDLFAVPADGWSFGGWTVSRDDVAAVDPSTCNPSTGPHCFVAILPATTAQCCDPVTAYVEMTATFVPAAVPPPPEVREPDGAFLCYSRFQVDPGVWPAAEAAALLAHGYWRPTAVAGALSATRLGAYSLVCNPPTSARLIDHGFVDDGGIRLAGVDDPWLGLYPIAGRADLAFP